MFVLLVRQQLGLYVSRQREVLSTNRTGIAPRQVGLAGIAEDVFASQFGGVRVFGVFVDDGGIAGNHRAIGGDQHFIIVRIDHLVAVAQAVEVPDHAHFDFAFFHCGDCRVGQRQAPLLGDFSEHQQCRFNILFIATFGNGSSQHAVGGLGGGAHVTDGDLVLAFLQVSPGFGGVGAVEQFLVDDERDGAGVGQCPVTVFVFRPIRDLSPGAWLVRLGHALFYRDRTEGCTHIADVRAGVVFLRSEFSDFLGRTHVGVDMGEAVVFQQVVPGAFPVGPVIGHADAVDRTFRFSRGLQGFQVGISSHGCCAQGNGRT